MSINYPYRINKRRAKNVIIYIKYMVSRHPLCIKQKDTQMWVFGRYSLA